MSRTGPGDPSSACSSAVRMLSRWSLIASSGGRSSRPVKIICPTDRPCGPPRRTATTTTLWSIW
ncbi:hypothetical protein BJF86_06545 [Serinicoccus sp. CNJ-927]|nr:hypothetical protein BJF86_06545 [Serinicoccus sp. CNJ-927]